MSITTRSVYQVGPSTRVENHHTTVNRFELADNVQANLGELVLQQVKE